MKRKNGTQKKEENIDGKDKDPLPFAKGRAMEMKKRIEKKEKQHQEAANKALQPTAQPQRGFASAELGR